MAKNAYLGDSSNLARGVKKIYVGRTITYTPIEYIESTGTQWINTGVLSNYLQFECKFKMTTTPTVNGYLAGAYNDGGTSNGTQANRYYALIFTVSNSSFIARSGNNTAINCGSFDSNIHTVIYNEYSTHAVKFDGTSKGTVADLTTANTMPVGLFCNLTTSATGVELGTCQMYYAKLTDTRTNTLIRDFIPVLDANNVACLYDKVTKTFYYNQGTGTFTAGSVTGDQVTVSNMAHLVKKAYVGVTTTLTPVEYIESNGTTQYINTWYRPNNNTRILADLDVSLTTAWKRPFGCFSGYEGTNRNLYAVETNDNGTSVKLYYGTGTVTLTITSGRNTWDFNKNVWKIGNASTSFSTQTFTVTLPCMLFAGTGNVPWIVNEPIMKLYSFKIYDNDILVRDYKPVKDDNGTYCLYEAISNTIHYDESGAGFTGGTATGDSDIVVSGARLAYKDNIKYFDANLAPTNWQGTSTSTTGFVRNYWYGYWRSNWQSKCNR